MRFLTVSLWATLAIGLSTIGCASTHGNSAEVSDSVYTDEVVYVTEDGVQVDPSEINLDDYEIVDETVADSNTNPNQVQTDSYTAIGEGDQAGQVPAEVVDVAEQARVTAAPPTNAYVSLDSPDYISLDSEQMTAQQEETEVGQEYVETAAPQYGSSSNESDYVSLEDDSDVTYEVADSPVQMNIETDVQNGDYVVVKSGDSLSKIARSIYGKLSMWKSLQSKNQIANADLIFPGDRIYYEKSGNMHAAEQAPNTREVTQSVAGPPIDNSATSYVVQQGDTLGSIAYRAYGSKDAWKKIQQLNPAAVENADYIYTGQTLKLK